jgi:hypothetical protein
MYIYIGTQMDKIPWQRKNQTQEALICIDTQNEESCSIMCTTDPDQARGGIATLVEKAQQDPLSCSDSQGGYPLLNNRWTSSGNCAFSLGQESYIMSQNEFGFVKNVKIMQTKDNVMENFTHCFFLLGVSEETHWIT